MSVQNLGDNTIAFVLPIAEIHSLINLLLEDFGAWHTKDPRNRNLDIEYDMILATGEQKFWRNIPECDWNSVSTPSYLGKTAGGIIVFDDDNDAMRFLLMIP